MVRDVGDVSFTRRRFLGALTLAGAAGLIGPRSEPLAPLLGSASATAAEPPPETTTIRLGWNRRYIDVCFAPYFYAEEFLRQEGFTDVQWVTYGGRGMDALASSETDFWLGFVGPWIRQIDAGVPVVMLAGQQVGCYMLFVNGPVRGVRDLRGRTIASAPPGSGDYLFLASLLAYVGLDPRRDVNIVSHPNPQAMQLFAEGKLDAYTVFSGTPPIAQELMKRKIGRVLINTMTDRPWSQYFCCMAVSTRDFIRRHPTATKRALRAMLRATDVIAREPARVAKFLVAKGYTDRYDYALQILREIPFDKWREYDHEDTVRFYSLRLRELELIRKSPLQIIAEGTDWRFLKELKREMKAP